MSVGGPLAASSSSVPLQPQVYPQPDSYIIAYYVLQFFGFVSLTILLATFAFAKTIKRDKTLWNLLGVFIAASICTSLVMLSGTLLDDKKTPFGLCLLNASLVMGGSPALSSAALSVVLRILLKILAAKGRFIRVSDSTVFTIFLLALPWAFWGALTICGIISGLKDRARVHKAIFYCALPDDSLNSASTAITSVTGGLTVLIGIAIAILLIRHYVKLRRIMRSNSSSSGHTSGQHSSRKVILRNKGEMSGVNLALTFRVGLYVLCVLLALVVSAFTIDNFTSVMGDFAITAIGPCVFFIFSSQQDILRAWGILRPAPLPSIPESTLVGRPDRDLPLPDESYHLKHLPGGSDSLSSMKGVSSFPPASDSGGADSSVTQHEWSQRAHRSLVGTDLLPNGLLSPSPNHSDNFGSPANATTTPIADKYGSQTQLQGPPSMTDEEEEEEDGGLDGDPDNRDNEVESWCAGTHYHSDLPAHHYLGRRVLVSIVQEQVWDQAQSEDLEQGRRAYR